MCIDHSAVSCSLGFTLAVDSDGVVTLIRPLDRETTPTFTVVIAATDQGVLTNQANVSFFSEPTVRNVTSTQSGMQWLYIIQGVLFRHTQEIDRLTRFVIEDIMPGLKTRQAFCQQVLIKIRPTTWNSSLFIRIYLVVMRYFLVQATVVVTVTDSNDNPPVFVVPSGGYVENILENTTIGSEVITVVATDLDLGANQIITYSLSSNNSLPFAIPDPTVSIVHENRLFFGAWVWRTCHYTKVGKLYSAKSRGYLIWRERYLHSSS